MKQFKILLLSLLVLGVSACSDEEESTEDASKKGTATVQRKSNEMIRKQGPISWKRGFEKYRTITVRARDCSFDITEIKAKQGEDVIIKIENEDAPHGITIPWMKISEMDEIILDTREIWEFEFVSRTYCQDDNDNMKGKIIIE